ncbi:unnamed protein product [Nesidiocoris tenuis]|uniref:Uncharacterized protein n=1 Tax=Nesidiocoris tenuis TaxID=355587 RepID=A0A6H5G966_9HEMI|nr:unnamed protein product [Nesidiocoris tenuis]
MYHYPNVKTGRQVWIIRYCESCDENRVDISEKAHKFGYEHEAGKRSDQAQEIYNQHEAGERFVVFDNFGTDDFQPVVIPDPVRSRTSLSGPGRAIPAKDEHIWSSTGLTDPRLACQVQEYPVRSSTGLYCSGLASPKKPAYFMHVTMILVKDETHWPTCACFLLAYFQISREPPIPAVERFWHNTIMTSRKSCSHYLPNRSPYLINDFLTPVKRVKYVGHMYYRPKAARSFLI